MFSVELSAAIAIAALSTLFCVSKVSVCMVWLFPLVVVHIVDD